MPIDTGVFDKIDQLVSHFTNDDASDGFKRLASELGIHERTLSRWQCRDHMPNQQKRDLIKSLYSSVFSTIL